MSFLKLIRWPNLLIITLSMVFTLFFVVRPGLGIMGFEAGLSPLSFFLLVFATLCIAIGGYLINDFYDMNADSVNKPGANQVGRKFGVFFVDILYWIFTVIGVLAGVVLAWMIDQLNYSLIFVFSAGLLWFYSSRYQCQPLVGNLVVAFLSALSFGLVWVFEFFALSTQADVFVNVQQSFRLVNRMVLVYIAFAFIVSFLREMVKDMQDVAGDDRFGCRTFAVVYGTKKATRVSLAVAILGLLGASWTHFYFYQMEFYYLFSYFFLVDLVFVYVIFLLFRAEKKEQFANLSAVIKILMFTGIISMVFFYLDSY